jgi:3-methyladenine DNA glycosylase AlkD
MLNPTANNLIKELNKCSNDSDAIFLQRFFKTGKGEYGEGDIFIGVRVPQTRKVCKKYQNINLIQVKKLLHSSIHEHRLGAVIILCDKAKKANKLELQNIYDLYMYGVNNNLINNWDIIDISARHIIGKYLKNKPNDILFELAKSNNLWKRRVAVLSTFSWISEGNVKTSLGLAEILVKDKEDLIQKAVGWMLREIGKQVDETILTDFLDKNVAIMPRTMLRYSLEKLPLKTRQYYMNK